MSTKKQTHDQSFFSAALSPAELADILRRVEEQMEQRPTRNVQSEERAGNHQDALAMLPDAYELAARLQALREQRAPLFVVRNRTPANLLRLLLNIPIRVFGYKQITFNKDLLNLADAMLATLQGTRHQLAQQQIELAILRNEVRTLRTAQTATSPAAEGV